jgi:hypothetical protein
MTGCCSFPNLGCLQIPTNTTTITGPPGAAGAAGGQGGIGLTGASGANGTTNIISDSTLGVTTNLVLTLIKTGVIPANTLVNNGDALNIRVSFYHTWANNSIINGDSFVIEFGGTSLVSLLSGFVPIVAMFSSIIDIRLSKVSTGTAQALVSYYGQSSALPTGYTETSLITGLTFTTSNNITISSVQAAASKVECKGLYVDLIKA